MTPGLSTLLLRDRPLNRDLLHKIHITGIASVELTDYHPGFAYDDPLLFVGLQEDLDALGLHLNSWHIHLEQFDHGFDLATLDTQQQEKALGAYTLAVDDMALLGGGILVTHDIRIPEPSEGQHDRKRVAFIENLRTVARYAEPKGVRIALENTPRGYTREPERLVALIDEAQAPNVGICIDTGHRHLSGDPVDAIRLAGRRLITLHIHDNHGETDDHLVPGRGDIVWMDVLQTLDDIAYPGIFMYELSRPEDLDAVYPNFLSLNL